MLEGLFYCRETAYEAIHLLRFIPQSGYVLAKQEHTNTIPDVRKLLKTFDMQGFDLIGEPEYIYVGAYFEAANKLSFKVGNEIRNSAEKWAEYDLLTFSGRIISETELHLTVTSKMRKYTHERIYLKVIGNTI